MYLCTGMCRYIPLLVFYCELVLRPLGVVLCQEFGGHWDTSAQIDLLYLELLLSKKCLEDRGVCGGVRGAAPFCWCKTVFIWSISIKCKKCSWHCTLSAQQGDAVKVVQPVRGGEIKLCGFIFCSVSLNSDDFHPTSQSQATHFWRDC